MRREIQKSLEDPISELLLKKSFQKGTMISVRMVNGKISFDIKPAKKVNKSI